MNHKLFRPSSSCWATCGPDQIGLLPRVLTNGRRKSSRGSGCPHSGGLPSPSRWFVVDLKHPPQNLFGYTFRGAHRLDDVSGCRRPSDRRLAFRLRGIYAVYPRIRVGACIARTLAPDMDTSAPRAVESSAGGSHSRQQSAHGSTEVSSTPAASIAAPSETSLSCASLKRTFDQLPSCSARVPDSRPTRDVRVCRWVLLRLRRCLRGAAGR